MSSGEIVLYEGLVVLVLVLGFGFWELASLKRANREAREQEARQNSASLEAQEPPADPRE